MRWVEVLQQHGYQVQAEEGTDIDPFLWLAQQAQAAQARGEPVTTISAKANSPEYSAVGFLVTITCPQDERSINLAGEIAFRKALELTNDGALAAGVQPLRSMG